MLSYKLSLALSWITQPAASSFSSISLRVSASSSVVSCKYQPFIIISLGRLCWKEKGNATDLTFPGHYITSLIKAIFEANSFYDFISGKYQFVKN
jgi:hypothetical protein